MKIITLLILTLLITGCDQPYSPEEEETFEDTDTVELETLDTDCLKSKACTVVWNPRCIVMDNADRTEVLRYKMGCICLDEVTHPVNEDQICTGSCYDNPNGTNYCVDKNGVIE